MSFKRPDSSELQLGQVSWVDPVTKEKKLGDKVMMLFIIDYLSRHEDLIHKYKIKVTKF